MAGLTIFDTVGLIGSALGIVGFGVDNFPGHYEPQGARVSVKGGLAANLTASGGGVDAVYGYDYDNQYLGSGRGGDMPDGGVFATTIDQSAPDTQADFVDVTFTNNAVCVAWITVNMHDGSPSGVWTGDVGSSCGETWYTQTQSAGELKNGGGQYIPRCTWFDADHTSPEHASLKFRTRAYGADGQGVIDGNHVCQSTIYGVDGTPVDGVPAKRRRNTLIRPQWMADRLIVSSIGQHSAMELCSSQTSWGPDFIDAHGQYCDMGTKKLSPLCSAKKVVGCVSVQGNRLMRLASVGKREVQLPNKAYNEVVQW